MADRPMLFSAPMVRALLEGRKTQTRRVLRPQPEFRGGAGDYRDAEEWGWEDEDGYHVSVLDICPNGIRIGDRLYVRETWQGLSHGDYLPTKSRICDLRYAATDPLADADRDVRGYPWRPSIHMPRWASRITLIVTDVRVERLQDISEADALAEGVTRCTWAEEMAGDGRTEWHVPAVTPGEYPGCTNSHPTPRGPFMELWDQINGPGAWQANPWICAITFDVHHCNIDQMPGAANA